MKLAIMQPYFFPYIGYFQLINAVDKFIFYDDVNFIKKGWINRNKILINNQPQYITISIKDISPNRLIKDTQIIDNRDKIKKTIFLNYKKAPLFEQVWPIIEDCLIFKTNFISELNIYSIKKICEYLGINKNFEVSSKNYTNTINLKKEKRLIEICKINNAQIYINPIGGQSIYKKETFLKEGIQLFFIKTKDISYKRFNDVFFNNLSIIDILMFNPIEKIIEMLNEYELI